MLIHEWHRDGVNHADPLHLAVDHLLDQGVRGFLTKPLDIKQLLELLDAIAAEQHRSIR